MSEQKEYIERGALIERLSGLVTTSDLFGMGVQAGFSHAITEANAIPAADVVEITRDASKAITHLDLCRVLTGEWSNRFDEVCNILYDASGNEVITTDRLRELATAEREGRVHINEYPNCGACKWATIIMFANREPCVACRERAEAARALAAEGAK